MKDQAYWAASTTTVGVIAALAMFDGVRDAQLAVSVAMIPLSVSFILLYALDGWHKSWFGRSIMLVAVSVLTYAISVQLYRVHGDYPGHDALTLVALGGVFLAMLLRTMVLWSVKKAVTKMEDADR